MKAKGLISQIWQHVQRTALKMHELDFLKSKYNETQIIEHILRVVLREAEFVIAATNIANEEVVYIAIPQKLHTTALQQVFDANWGPFKDLMFPKAGSLRLVQVSTTLNNPDITRKIIYKVVEKKDKDA